MLARYFRLGEPFLIFLYLQCIPVLEVCFLSKKLGLLSFECKIFFQIHCLFKCSDIPNPSTVSHNTSYLVSVWRSLTVHKAVIDIRVPQLRRYEVFPFYIPTEAIDHKEFSIYIPCYWLRHSIFLYEMSCNKRTRMKELVRTE